MLELRYIYLIGTLLCFIPWFIFYFYRRDLRKEMLTMSILLGFYGLLTDYFWYTSDWWQPHTLMGTRVGIESFLLGFSNGGAISVVYAFIFQKKNRQFKKAQNTFGAVALLLFHILLTSFLLIILHVPSPISANLGIALAGILLVLKRRDLLACAIASAFLTLVASLQVYYFLARFFPEFAKSTYFFNRLSGPTFIGIPIEDYIFYFLVGFLFGPFYKFWKNERLTDKNS